MNEFRLTRIGQDVITKAPLWHVVNSAGIIQTEPVCLRTAVRIWACLNNGASADASYAGKTGRELLRNAIVDLALYRRSQIKESIFDNVEELTNMLDELLDLRASQLGL